MRVLRAKHIRKYLNFFRIVFGIKPPFSIILDGNFIFQCLKFKIDIRERLSKLLQGSEIKLYVLRSSINELMKAGDKATNALQFSQNFCEILEDNIVIEDLKLRVADFLDSNKARRNFLFASQDKSLRAFLSERPGIPLLYLNKVTLVLEPPSDASKEHNRKLESSKSSLNKEEESVVHKLNKSESKKIDKELEKDKLIINPATMTLTRPKKRTSEPNPLSSLTPSKDSKKSKKRKLNKFRK